MVQSAGNVATRKKGLEADVKNRGTSARVCVREFFCQRIRIDRICRGPRIVVGPAKP